MIGPAVRGGHRSAPARALASVELPAERGPVSTPESICGRKPDTETHSLGKSAHSSVPRAVRIHPQVWGLLDGHRICNTRHDAIWAQSFCRDVLYICSRHANECINWSLNEGSLGVAIIMRDFGSNGSRPREARRRSSTYREHHHPDHGRLLGASCHLQA